MSFIIKKAERKRARMRIGLFGPSGSGKTMSALKLAYGLVGDWNKIIVIDTEQESSSLYSQLGDYNTCPLNAPFDPRRYIEAIKTCEKAGFEVIIVDSVSHEWEGIGGCLDIRERLGGKFENWAKVTPLHNQFISAITQSTSHIITTGRSKVDYQFEGKKDGGKGKVEKVGMKAITREGFEYELTISFTINQDHYASIDKDRTNLFKDCAPFIITEDVGKLIGEWNQLGIIAPIEEKQETALPPVKTIKDEYVIEIIRLLGEASKPLNLQTPEEKRNFMIERIGVSSGKDLAVMDEQRLASIVEKLKILT